MTSSTLPWVSISFLASFLWLKCTLAPENSGAMGPLSAWRLAIRSWDTVLWFVFGLKEVVVASEGIIHFNKIVSSSRDIRTFISKPMNVRNFFVLNINVFARTIAGYKRFGKTKYLSTPLYTQANINKHTCTLTPTQDFTYLGSLWRTSRVFAAGPWRPLGSEGGRP